MVEDVEPEGVVAEPGDPGYVAIPPVGESTRDRVVLAVGIIAAAAVVWALRDDPLTAILMASVVPICAWLSAIDFNVHRLPNKIVGPLAAWAAFAVALLGLVDGDLGRSVTALLVAAAVFAGLMIAGLLGAIGMGDVKFSFPLAALLMWFGSDSLTQAGMVAIFVGGFWSLGVLIITRKRHQYVPFGPFMSLGFVVAMLLAG